jgi:16S rRNA (uracil1498-N3)-methyltransferase
MRRFLFNKENIKNGVVSLEPDQSHHLINVLRMKQGEDVVLIDRNLGSFIARIIDIKNQKAILEIRESIKGEKNSVNIAVFQSLLPRGRMDGLIRPLTEIGIDMFVPIISKRCVPKITAQQGLIKRQRWERIALESAKQCGINKIPEIFMPICIRDAFLMAKNAGLILMPTLIGKREGIDKALKDSMNSVSIFIGPEGDFTLDEVKMGMEFGARIVDLGENVLRSETAAVYTASIVHFVCYRRL